MMFKRKRRKKDREKDRENKRIKLNEELVSVILHEVRAPLSSIKGYASLLITGEVGQPSPKQKETAKKIIRLCDSLSALLSDYMHFSGLKLKKSVENRNWILLTDSLTRAIETESAEANKKNIKVTLEPSKHVNKMWGRESDFDCIFTNLLDNAIKFSYNGSKIRIILTDEKSFLKVIVQDEGIGVSKESIKKIFDPFYHIGSPQTQATRGSGLGLTIVKRIIKTYNGKVWVESKVGKGSKFFVQVPILTKEEAFNQYLTYKLKQALEQKEEFSLLLIRLLYTDRFKSFNSNVKAKILEFIEQKILSVIRSEDKLFCLTRKKNDFITVLSNAGKDNVKVLEQRIKEKLQEGEKEFSLEGMKIDSSEIKFKFGAATCPKEGKTKERLLSVSEKKLS